MNRQSIEYQTFSHDAMSTTFEIRVAGAADTYKTQAAREAFALLDRLEQQLSHFRENSDITRLNLAPVGESVLLHLETFACLSRAKTLFDKTNGALDVTLGRKTAENYDDAPAEAKPFIRETEHAPERIGDPTAGIGMTYLKLDTATMTATRLSEAVQLDLGAIGKGFALDRMATCLTQWKLTQCLLHGGASTALALDAPKDNTGGWPVTVTCPTDQSTLATFALKRSAFSGSAQTQRLHIIDPGTGDYVRDRMAAWAMAADAVTADGLSTAFMILAKKDIRDLCQEDPDIGAVIVYKEEDTASLCRYATFGRWSPKKPV